MSDSLEAEVEARGSQVGDQPGLQSKFKVSPGD